MEFLWIVLSKALFIDRCNCKTIWVVINIIHFIHITMLVTMDYTKIITFDSTPWFSTIDNWQLTSFLHCHRWRKLLPSHLWSSFWNCSVSRPRITLSTLKKMSTRICFKSFNNNAYDCVISNTNTPHTNCIRLHTNCIRLYFCCLLSACLSRLV